MRCSRPRTPDATETDFLEHVGAVHLDGFLLEVADGGVLGLDDAARVRILLSGDDREQRCLAGAVGADERDAVAGTHAKERVSEQDAFANGLGDMVDCDDHG